MSSVAYNTPAPAYNLPPRQKAPVVKGLRNELFTFPPATAPVFGSTCSFKIANAGGIMLHNVWLQVQLSAVSGLTGSVTNYPAHNPSWFFVKSIDININGQLAQTFPAAGLSQYLLHSVFSSDEERSIIEGTAGSHTSVVHRCGKTATAGDTWLIPLRSFWKEASFPVYSALQEIEIKVLFDVPANFVAQSTLTGTPVCSIQTASLLAYATRVPTQIVVNELSSLTTIPQHKRFHKEVYIQTNLISGSSSTNITLSGLGGGRFDYIMFVVRPQSAITGITANQFTPITSYHYLDSAGQSMCGGNAITHFQALSALGRRNCRSSLLSESPLGIYNSNVYIWSPNTNPIESFEDGLHLTSYPFTGTEQLVLSYPTLGSAYFVDIFAYRLELLTISKNGVSIQPQTMV